MKITSRSLESSISLEDALRIEAGNLQFLQNDWFSSGGAEHEAMTDIYAAEVVRAFRPEQTTKAEAMKPGWAGLASYKLPYDDGDKHLKIAMVRPNMKLESYNEVCQGAMGEARRAAWAGARGLGPEVRFTCPTLGAFVCDFVPGRVPSLSEIQGPLMQNYLTAMASIHNQPVDGVPEGGQINWLMDGMYCKVHLAEASDPRPKALQQALLQVESGLESFIAKQATTPVPIHDDFKPENTLLSNNKIVVLDWNNLRVADAAIDLGHFAVTADIAAKDVISAYIEGYISERSRDGLVFDRASLSASALAYTGLFRLRNATFFDQWASSRTKAEYFRHQLAGDVAALNQSIFKEMDLRPSLEAG